MATTDDDVVTVEDLDALRDWLVEKGHISQEEKDTVSIMACRTGGAALVASSGKQPPVEGSEVADSVNKVEISGVVKWEPKFFEPREEGQKLIGVFAIEWVRPKSDNKRSVFHIKAFGDLAEELQKEKLDQGDTVTVVGSLNETKWKDKQTDEWKNRIEVWGNKIEFVERADGGSGEDFGGGAAAADDDIPF